MRVILYSGKHILYLDTIADSGKFHRDMAERMFMAPVITVAPLNATPQAYSKQYRTMVSSCYKRTYRLRYVCRSLAQYLCL